MLRESLADGGSGVALQELLACGLVHKFQLNAQERVCIMQLQDLVSLETPSSVCSMRRIVEKLISIRLFKQ